MSYKQLIDDHDEIDRLTRELDVVANAAHPDPASASEVLLSLATAVREHLAHEDRTIYSRLTNGKRRPPGTPEIDFEAAFQELSDDWQTYLSDWNLDLLACDWPSFVAETAAMMARLRIRVRDETNLIYPLAMQQGLIGLRSDPQLP